ncbi:adenylosuccinate lyase [Allomuricauda sp. SCSIO 65647]|uniref:adenylosuccinate lyase n=1 Tax=Allomuricauda sp. SCSIO 65647 TaxID=2908843 RepID=UPI001F292854|nr:adenylosuccinate lyase [Muricauda sp. SCSIO 65647]UJH67663.1 adenylosuccinate lyase [Muricauda sp. SCSIO 65647]
MTKEQLHQKLNSGRLSKVQIDGLVAELEQHPELVGHLLQEVFEEDKGDTFNASWTFDHLMRKKLPYLLPFLQPFVDGLETLRSQSCIRPMAHVCELLTIAYFKKKDPAFQKNISDENLEQLVTVCFDWLIGQNKVAAKVFAMTSLSHLGEKFDWVHPELKMVLEQTISSGTAGYKNRAKKTLDRLKALRH